MLTSRAIVTCDKWSDVSSLDEASFFLYHLEKKYLSILCSRDDHISTTLSIPNYKSLWLS
jgi:hypothetical protein